MTVATVLALYGEEHAPQTADPARIGQCIDALLPFWGGHRVAAIKGETCRRYARERGVAPGTARRELGCLAAALTHCVREGYLTTAPLVWLPPKPAPKDRWLTRGEAATLVRAACSEPKARLHLPLFVLIGLYTGARRDAILALQWQPNLHGGHVDLGRGRIDFNPLGRRQTKKTRPVIPIPKRLMRFLAYARMRTRQYVIERDGLPVAAVKRSFATACRKAGLQDVSPHTLRHTCATWLAQRGVRARDAADFLGMTEDTFERVYYHHHPDHMRAAREALD